MNPRIIIMLVVMVGCLALWLGGCTSVQPIRCEPGALASARCFDDQDRQRQGTGTEKPEPPSKPDKPDKPDCPKDKHR